MLRKLTTETRHRVVAELGGPEEVYRRSVTDLSPDTYRRFVREMGGVRDSSGRLDCPEDEAVPLALETPVGGSATVASPAADCGLRTLLCEAATQGVAGVADPALRSRYAGRSTSCGLSETAGGDTRPAGTGAGSGVVPSAGATTTPGATMAPPLGGPAGRPKALTGVEDTAGEDATGTSGATGGAGPAGRREATANRGAGGRGAGGGGAVVGGVGAGVCSRRIVVEDDGRWAAGARKRQCTQGGEGPKAAGGAKGRRGRKLPTKAASGVPDVSRGRTHK
jgi:hypothetical protein